jgi:peptidyl-tRNA hydrolase
MTDKKKTDQSASLKTSRVNDTSASAQRARLLSRLQVEQADTIVIRDELNIMMPAARIKELRDRGHDIRKHVISRMDARGRMHRGIALYYLSTGHAGVMEAAL